MCHHCSEVRDTAQHTLEVCPAWDEQRRVLRSIVGEDLSLPAVVSAMLGSEDAWVAMVSCEQVMLQKEAAERDREDDPSSDPIRRRRRGARRRAYARQFP